MKRLARSLRLAAIGGAALAILLSATPRASSDAAPPAATGEVLACEFKAVQTGQFQNFDFITGPPGGLLNLRFANSPEDAAAGRAVMLGDQKSVVVARIVGPEQTVYVETDTPDDASMMTLFTAARKEATIPAAYSRQMMIGRIPIVSQYAGTCTVR